MLNLYKISDGYPEIKYSQINPGEGQPSPFLTEKPAEAGKPFVLILGSDKDTRFLFKTAFELWNFDVAEADNQEQIFSISAFKVPDLILIDSQFDFQESLALLKNLKICSLLNGCGLMLISGHAQKKIRQTALSEGADLFLVKPIDFELLEKSLRRYFQEKDLAVLRV